MNVLLLGDGLDVVASAIRAAGHTPTRLGDVRPADAVLIAAGATIGDWYTLGKCFAHGSEVCAFGRPNDPELADLTFAVTPAEALAWLASVPYRAPRGHRKTRGGQPVG